ncbi:MAG: SDR family oxidoreductase [Stenotrophomonas sp.]
MSAVSARGLRVNAMGPGFIDTPLLQGMDDRAYAYLVAWHPAGQPGTAKAATLTCFLLSDKASFTTGNHHVVAGGYS